MQIWMVTRLLYFCFWECLVWGYSSDTFSFPREVSSVIIALKLGQVPYKVPCVPFLTTRTLCTTFRSILGPASGLSWNFSLFDLQPPSIHMVGWGEKVAQCWWEVRCHSRPVRDDQQGSLPPLPPHDPKGSITDSEASSLLPRTHPPTAQTSLKTSVSPSNAFTLIQATLIFCLDGYRGLGSDFLLPRTVEPVFMLYESVHSTFTHYSWA